MCGLSCVRERIARQLLAWLTLWLALPGSAPAEPLLAPTEDGRPRIAMKRTEVAPVIDGNLDDLVWRDAPVIGPLTQVEPVEGAPPSQPTEVKLLYDSDALYVAVRCFDSEPEKIQALQILRDKPVNSDDFFSIVLDTFFDERNGYMFATNAMGNKVDGLLPNGGWEGEWDGIWYVEAGRDGQGWYAEVAIPFKTVNFNPAGTRWGFNFERQIRRNNEVQRFAQPYQDRNNGNTSKVAILENLRGLEQGLGLDVKPSMSMRYRRERENQRRTRSGDPALDVFYKITPSLTGVLTFNTDFAEADVDERQVNLTRFNLFFPEQRDFFLQDTGIFDFGGRTELSALPFFSRRIGIAPDGSEVAIDAGVKLTGRAAGVNLGLISVRMEDHHEIDRKTLSVGRLSLNVLEESEVGVIATLGDPGSNQDAGLIGADFNYRNSKAFGNQQLRGNLWVQKSFSEGAHDREAAFGAKLDYPALGFVNRLRGVPAFRRYDGQYRYRYRRNAWLRLIDFKAETKLITDLSNELVSSSLTLSLPEISTALEDLMSFKLIAAEEHLQVPWEISEGVVIGVGSYRFDRVAIEAETSEAHIVGGGLGVNFGEFYDGDSVETTAALEWRPTPHFFARVEYEQSDVRLPEGDFTTRLARARLNLTFNTRTSWNTIAQYENVTDQVGIHSRLRWIIEPGNEVFLVLNHGMDVDGSSVRSASSQITTKVAWTFRF
jgi:hypothetical protein